MADGEFILIDDTAISKVEELPKLIGVGRVCVNSQLVEAGGYAVRVGHLVHEILLGHVAVMVMADAGEELRHLGNPLLPLPPCLLVPESPGANSC